MQGTQFEKISLTHSTKQQLEKKKINAARTTGNLRTSHWRILQNNNAKKKQLQKIWGGAKRLIFNSLYLFQNHS